MIILGIDTSCDDTCIAILEIENCKFKILSNIVSSQVKLHAKYGGVYPMLAKREHQKNLPIVLKETAKKINLSKIDYIAVTFGPGLEPCLWAGINFAQELSEKLKKPIIPINHIEGHIVANWLSPINEKPETRNPKPEIKFPAICLVVSGGHTEIILMKDIGKYTPGDILPSFKYKLIGGTRDDAAGECFDKVARILGLGYPGGPAIAEFAQRWKSEARNPKSQIKLPRPMINQKNYDFSFSGLKTAVLYQVKSTGSKAKNKKYIEEMCAETQQAIIDVLIHKTIKAAKDYRVKLIILGGGVAANEELRKQLRERIKKGIPNTKYLIPDTKYCTDNAAMIAAVAGLNPAKPIKNLKEIKADGNLQI